MRLFRCDHLVQFSTKPCPEARIVGLEEASTVLRDDPHSDGGREMVIRAPRHKDSCGFQRGALICESEPHPQHPNGHVYVSNVGSHVADRHGGAS